ncbi:MAG: ATP-binding protein [Candidatus Goldbacteria bacterium]|nr:ATP-binding protein [Candidatus Goldiibacteriota bacterium]
MTMKIYIRKQLYTRLKKHLEGNVNLIQAVVGPRQVGKTTLVKQIFNEWKGPKFYETADLPEVVDTQWLMRVWNKAREAAKKERKRTLLIIDEIQKISHWSTIVKRLFDEDKFSRINLRVVILGSSSLLMQRGLTESLAGRFELHRHSQWSFKECSEFAGIKLNEYIYYGGYPAALQIRKDYHRWMDYIKDSLVEAVIAKDVLLMNPITKPALLRQAFALCLHYPAQILSYQNMLGQLQEAGNASTIAFYLKLLSNAFFIIPLEKFSGSRIRQKSSSPKILFLDNSIVTANSNVNYRQTFKDSMYWGRLIENAVGARLYWLAQEYGGELFYWRERDNEVDYVFKIGNKLKAIEVKSGNPGKAASALKIFSKRYEKTDKIVITYKKIVKMPEFKSFEAEEFFLNPEIII